MPSIQSRNYSFTWNNYTDVDIQYLKALPQLTYLVIGKELAPSTGTPHLQGTIVFNKNKTQSAVRMILNGCHVEITRNLQASIDYCMKDTEYLEVGTRPLTPGAAGKESEIARWELAVTNAKNGDMHLIPADMYVRCYRTWKEIRKDHMPHVDSIEVLDNEWIQGPSGCGKTSFVLALYPDAYLKTANKWWDGYQGEDTVLIDDLDETHKCLIHHLKIWGDHKPFLAETKGGMIKIRPKRIIITSNVKLSSFAESEHLVALERRYKVKCSFEKTCYPIFLNNNRIEK